ncbi:MAG: hypothetical protein KBC60_08430, partial [Haliscomenobacter sp.]|nr:hypothetical protein [Haliscomenobacter sp.]
VRCTMCDVRCTMYDVRCTMYDVRCAMCDVRCTMYDVPCWSKSSDFDPIRRSLTANWRSGANPFTALKR